MLCFLDLVRIQWGEVLAVAVVVVVVVVEATAEALLACLDLC